MGVARPFVVDRLDGALAGPHQAVDGSKLDSLIAHDRALQGRDEFVDDFSFVELQFG